MAFSTPGSFYPERGERGVGSGEWGVGTIPYCLLPTSPPQGRGAGPGTVPGSGHLKDSARPAHPERAVRVEEHAGTSAGPKFPHLHWAVPGEWRVASGEKKA